MKGVIIIMEENVVFNSNKVMGILAYIGILFLVPMLAAKDSQYAKFHANQGLVLFILNIAASVVSFILGLVFGLIKLGFLATLISGVLSLGCFALMIIGIINACSGEPKKLPIIGGLQLIK